MPLEEGSQNGPRVGNRQNLCHFLADVVFCLTFSLHPKIFLLPDESRFDWVRGCNSFRQIIVCSLLQIRTMSARVRQPLGVKTVKHRKQIDWDQTLNNYEKRLRSYPKNVFTHLEGAYLSDFIHKGTSHIPILEGICERHGVNILGIIFENKKNGTYLYVPEDFDSNANVVYVGRPNNITGHLESPFGIVKDDISWK